MTQTDITSALTEALEKIQTTLNQENAQLNIYSGKQKMPILNAFVLLFAQSFLATIDEYNLTRNDIRCVLKIIEYMQFGNLLRLSNAAIARELNMHPNHFSRSLKNLKNAKIVIDIGGNLYLNPHIITKGRFKQNSDIDMEILDKAAEQLEGTNISPSIETPKMRRKKQKQDAPF